MENMNAKAVTFSYSLKCDISVLNLQRWATMVLLCRYYSQRRKKMIKFAQKKSKSELNILLCILSNDLIHGVYWSSKCSFATWINKFSSIVPSKTKQKQKFNRKRNAVVKKHLLTSWEATIKCLFDYIVQYTHYSVLSTHICLFILFVWIFHLLSNHIEQLPKENQNKEKRIMTTSKNQIVSLWFH